MHRPVVRHTKPRSGSQRYLHMCMYIDIHRCTYTYTHIEEAVVVQNWCVCVCVVGLLAA